MSTDEKDGGHGRTRKCADCAEMVQPDARICRYCRYVFVPVDAARSGEGERRGGSSAAPSGYVRIEPGRFTMGSPSADWNDDECYRPSYLMGERSGSAMGIIAPAV